jgi:hypothetical protein
VILIVANSYDLTVQEISRILGVRKVDHTLIDPATLPMSGLLSYHISDDIGPKFLIRASTNNIDLSKATAGWYWHPCPPIVSCGEDSDINDLCSREWRWFLQGIWRGLPHLRWLNTPWHAECAEHKLLQLQVARELGFNLPPTLVSNDPAEIARFHRRFDGNIIHKLIRSKIFGKPPETEYVIYTEPVTRRAIADIKGLAMAPSIYQPNLSKLLELRVTVIGKNVFAAAIHSQSSAHSKQDYRRYDIANTPYETYQLPKELEQKCISLLRALGLRYGAIDFILTPGGDHIFLEVNPSGQFGWIEGLTGLPIANALADELVALSSQ